MLPEDIIEENILTRLPVKSIARFRFVSKSWRLLFQNPNFIKNHLNHANLTNNFNILVSNYPGAGKYRTEASLYSIDYLFSGHAHKIDYPFMYDRLPPQILGSCNGLVCLQPFPHNICIWNLATREYKRLPRSPVGYPSAEAKGSMLIYAHGFGFDSRNDDYKVLRIVNFMEDKVSEARIYSLASDSWKVLGFIPYILCFTKNDGILLNGVLHWIATVRRNGLKSSVTLCYDLSDETFCDVPLPYTNSIEEEYLLLLDLGIWDGKLCLLDRRQDDHIDVWTMMNNKWVKHLKITAHVTDISYQRPIQTLQSGEILFQSRPYGIGLMAYNPNLQRARALKIHGLPDKSDLMENQTYVETLVPLNSGTYVGQ